LTLGNFLPTMPWQEIRQTGNFSSLLTNNDLVINNISK